MRPTVMLLAVCACSCSVFRPSVLPDPTVAHRLAADADVLVWARQPDGSLVKTKVRFQAGDYCASKLAVGEAP